MISSYHIRLKIKEQFQNIYIKRKLRIWNFEVTYFISSEGIVAMKKKISLKNSTHKCV